MRNLTLEKLKFIESQCVNPQDAIIISLLIEGVDISELVGLKQDSLDLKNRILTIKDCYGKQRKMVISDRCVELFQSAVKQSTYILNSGFNQSKQRTVSLKYSDYLIKVCLEDYIANESMITEIDSVIKRAVYMRLNRLAELYAFDELPQLSTVKLKLKEPAYA